jgi:tetratricopeptide (TPR) repeat protein
LKTWSISVDRIRSENWPAYRILHILAFVDNQNIPFQILAAASGCGSESIVDVKEAVARLREFSFLSMRQTKEGEASYDVHKLVQEATQYSLSTSIDGQKGEHEDVGLGEEGPEAEAYFASVALDVVAELFPKPRRETWEECEKYLTHATRVSEWAQVSGKRIETADLLGWVSDFLYERGRWREKEPVDVECLALRRDVLGERHPDTIFSMASLAVTYHAQGRYDEDEKISVEVLALRRDVLGERHPDTISSMASLATTYHAQGRYDEAEKIYVKVLALRRDVLGERHPYTIRSMADLATTYHAQGRYDEAEKIKVEVLALRQHVLGERHPDTLQAMHDLAITWNTLHRSELALSLMQQCCVLQGDVLGAAHPTTVQTATRLEEWELRQRSSDKENEHK